ncbi:MAG: hypothetical protein FWD34_06415 [Oscillospiraceae bacterium]|nr:hypothetical protein [Oscillospiraceae bacterium]
MTRNKAIVFIITTLTLCIILLSIVGCVKSEPENNYLLGDGKSMPLYTLCLLDDGYIYFDLRDKSDVPYYRYYFEDDRTIELGRVPRYMLSGNSEALIDNIYYFFVGVFNENQEFMNVLYAINLEENTFYPVMTDTEHVFIESCSYKNRYIVALLGSSDGNNVYTSYLSLFDTQTKQFINKSEAFSFDEITRADGRSVGGFCTFKDYIYVFVNDTLLDDSVDGDGFIHNDVIHVYDFDFNLVQVIGLGEAHDALTKYWSVKMKVLDNNLIYVRNFSRYSVIGIIEDDLIKPLLLNDGDDRMDIDMSDYGLNEPPILFARYTNNIFTIDTKTQSVNKIELDIKDGFHIIYMMTSDENSVLILMGENGYESITYYVPNEKLSELEFGY